MRGCIRIFESHPYPTLIKRSGVDRERSGQELTEDCRSCSEIRSGVDRGLQELQRGAGSAGVAELPQRMRNECMERVLIGLGKAGQERTAAEAALNQEPNCAAPCRDEQRPSSSPHIASADPSTVRLKGVPAMRSSWLAVCSRWEEEFLQSAFGVWPCTRLRRSVAASCF